MHPLTKKYQNLIHKRTDILLLLLALIWGSTFVSVKSAIAVMPPLTFVAWRFGIAGITLCLIFWKSLRRAKARDVFIAVVIGAILAFGYIFQTVGLLATSAGKSGFITGLSIIFVPLIEFVFLRKILTRKQLIGTILATIGLGLLTLSESLTLVWWDFWTVGCAILFAGQILAIGHFAKASSASTIAAVQIITVAVIAFLAAAILEPPVDYTLVKSDVWLNLLYVSLIATTFSYVLQTDLQRVAPPARVALILGTETVFAALTGWIVMQEILTTKELIGCALIFAGIIACELDIKSTGSKLWQLRKILPIRSIK